MKIRIALTLYCIVKGELMENRIFRNMQILLMKFEMT